MSITWRCQLSYTHEGSNPQQNPAQNGLDKLPPIPSDLDPITDVNHPEYNAFDDPDSPFYGLTNFRPRSSRPIPTLRCTGIVKSTGLPCKNRAIRGHGLMAGMVEDKGVLVPAASNAKCNVHGGRLPPVAKASARIVDAARLQMMSSAPDAIQTIMRLMTVAGGAPHNVQLAAAKEVLDRVGVNSKQEVAVEVSHNIKPSEVLLKKLEAMRRTKNPEPEEGVIEDAEEVFEDLGETKES